MPGVDSLDALERAIAEFAITDLEPDLELDLEPAALAAACRSLAESGLLLLGEIHGVRENPLLIRALMTALGATGLALEWDENLAPVVDDFVRGVPLRDHRLLWSGDGRITAGHLAVLREGVTAGWLRTLTLFGGTGGVDWDWSARDAAMARRVLAAQAAEGGTLVVALPTASEALVPHRAGLWETRPWEADSRGAGPGRPSGTRGSVDGMRVGVIRGAVR